MASENHYVSRGSSGRRRQPGQDFLKQLVEAIEPRGVLGLNLGDTHDCPVQTIPAGGWCFPLPPFLGSQRFGRDDDDGGCAGMGSLKSAAIRAGGPGSAPRPG